MQVIDNALVLHNLEEKCSQVYEFKVADYGNPMLVPNLEVDPSFAMRGAYFSDLIFDEERELSQEAEFKGLKGSMSQGSTSVFEEGKSEDDIAKQQIIEETKAIQERNNEQKHKLSFTLPDKIDGSQPIDIYDDKNVFFIAPMFIIHRSLKLSLSLKMSLKSFI